MAGSWVTTTKAALSWPSSSISSSTWAAEVRVQVAGGLVHQHHVRAAHQCPGDGDALALPAGELSRAVIQPVGHAHPLQHPRRPAPGLRPRHAGDKQRHAHVFPGVELRQQVVKLVDKAQALVAQLAQLPLAQRRQVLPRHQHPAAAGVIQAAEQVQEGRLAGTRSADDGNLFPRPQAELHIFQDVHPPAAILVSAGTATRSAAPDYS